VEEEGTNGGRANGVFKFNISPCVASLKRGSLSFWQEAGSGGSKGGNGETSHDDAIWLDESACLWKSSIWRSSKDSFPAGPGGVMVKDCA
jgi:hypothetical protein